MIRDHRVDPCHRRACRHIIVLRHPFRPTVLRPRWPVTEAIRSTITRRPAWTSTAHTERPVPAATVRPVQPKVATVPTVTARVRTAARQWPRRATRPERSMTPVITITALERTTAGIKPDTHRTTANRTAPPLITVPSQRKPIPVSSTMTDQAATLVTTRKPTRKATQRPISTLMVVIIRRTKTKTQREIEKNQAKIANKVCESV